MTRLRAPLFTFLLLALALVAVAPNTPAGAADGVGGDTAVEAPPGPVQAQGDGYWSDTTCWHGTPVWGIYKGFPGQGANYGSVFVDNSAPSTAVIFWNPAQQWIGFRFIGVLHALFIRSGGECYLGFPIDVARRHNDPNPARAYVGQLVYLPGTCSLRMMVRTDTGAEGVVVTNNVFCVGPN